LSSVTRYEVFDTEMRAWVDAQRKTEIALRHGIERDEFELHYQPVVALESLEICGFEALVRWNHPYLGLLPPNEFVPVAEDSGLIVPMGEWILREAIRQSAQWQERAPSADRPIGVSINLSARQIAQPELVDVVRRALDDVDVDPGCVAFEITETVLLDDVAAVEHTLADLKDLGVRLSLDDFGTGYSSLTYLCRLPIDIVKVDRSFVSQLGTGRRDASIVEMVVAMARTLNLDVVAEGVETPEQAERLKAFGCKYGQGFLFSKPVPAPEVELLFGERRISYESSGGVTRSEA
jgi:EAL domain-containing protein (putative c-di-GMP-specific phosphodiesterase class I)